MSLRRIAAAACAICSLAAATAADAATPRSVTSSNWAGYAVSRSGLRFHKVAGSWIQPAARCAPGHRAYSAYWVGLGGFHRSSRALEQVGTLADCGARGRATYAAWFEIVPAAPLAVAMTVRPGDRMSASVAVHGRAVTLRLADRTRGTRFVNRVRARRVDATSAEWVVEAPSACLGARCRTLALADFGSATFSKASATTTGGHTGSILDPAWTASAIALRADAGTSMGGRIVEDASGDGATAGAPTPAGDGFAVAFAPGA